MRHPGVDPSVARPGAAHTVAANRRSGGHLPLPLPSPDHPHQCPPPLLPDHQGAAAVPLAAVGAPGVGAQLAARHRAVPRPCTGGQAVTLLQHRSCPPVTHTGSVLARMVCWVSFSTLLVSPLSCACAVNTTATPSPPHLRGAPPRHVCRGARVAAARVRGQTRGEHVAGEDDLLQHQHSTPSTSPVQCP